MPDWKKRAGKKVKAIQKDLDWVYSYVREKAGEPPCVGSLAEAIGYCAKAQNQIKTDPPTRSTPGNRRLKRQGKL